MCGTALINFRCVRSKILWVKFRYSRVKLRLVVGYGPIEGNSEEGNIFWNDLDKVADRVGNGYRLCVVGDLNGWIADIVRGGIIGAFGVS